MMKILFVNFLLPLLMVMGNMLLSIEVDGQNLHYDGIKDVPIIFTFDGRSISKCFDSLHVFEITTAWYKDREYGKKRINQFYSDSGMLYIQQCVTMAKNNANRLSDIVDDDLYEYNIRRLGGEKSRYIVEGYAGHFKMFIIIYGSHYFVTHIRYDDYQHPDKIEILFYQKDDDLITLRIDMFRKKKKYEFRWVSISENIVYTCTSLRAVMKPIPSNFR